MPKLVNRVRVATATTGTGPTLALGAALTGYRTLADAGVPDGSRVRYVAFDPPANWEIGIGVYSAAGPTLTREVSESSNSNNPINLSGSAEVFVDAVAEDIQGENIVTRTASYTAAHRDHVLTDTSGGAFTVTLPASPAFGDTVRVSDTAASWATNNLTVARNGQTIEGVAEDLVCDTDSQSVSLVFDGADWVIVTVSTSVSLTNGALGTMATEDAADYAALAGATFTGAINTEGVFQKPLNAASGPTLTIDVEQYGCAGMTVTEDLTIAITQPATKYWSIFVELEFAGDYTLTMPAGNTWHDGQPPTGMTNGTKLGLTISNGPTFGLTTRVNFRTDP